MMMNERYEIYTSVWLSLGQNDGNQFVEIEGTFFVQLNDLSDLKINA